jgi:hypothetical protein
LELGQACTHVQKKKWSSDFSAGVDDTKKKRDGKERRNL